MIENEINLKTNKATEISKKAAKGIREKIEWLIAQAEWKTITDPETKKRFRFKINFITLTLSSPQCHSDKVIKSQLLNQFITELRQKFKLQNYIWRAERQKNGNLHFHITTDIYVGWQWIQRTWNRVQNKLNYIDKFEDKHGHRNPNSTDIHSVKNLKNVAAYLTKYLTKNDKNAKVIEGRQWFISQNLSKNAKMTLTEDEVSYQEINEELRHAEVEKKISLKYATAYYHNWDKVIKQSEGSQIFDDYNAQLEKIRKGTIGSP